MQRANTEPMPILPVILAGGIGARLAPISTPRRPKPFIPLQDGESLLTKTLARVKTPAFLPPLLIGRAHDRFALLNHSRAAGVAPEAILLEANGRNTAPAVALAALWAQAHHGDGTMLAILPADHAINPAEAWQATVQYAAEAARTSGAICLLTATPQAPDASFGYALPGASSAHYPWQNVTRFVEKPADPASLVAQGARWNMGQFIGSARQFIAALEEHAPATLAAAKALLSAAERHWEFTELGEWPEATKAQPFDKAVLERAPSVMMPFTGQWQDLGHLEAWRAFTGLEIEDYAHQPARTDRPWGYFEEMRIAQNEVHKRLIIYPDCRLSLQRHQRRAEHWRVILGTAYVELENEVKRLKENQEITIPTGMWHRLGNHHTDILIIEEIQMGICDEMDIERIEDDYGRS